MCKDCGCSLGGLGDKNGSNLSGGAHSHGDLHDKNGLHSHDGGLTWHSHKSHAHAHENHDHSHSHAHTGQGEHSHAHENHAHSHSHSHENPQSHSHPVLNERKTIDVITKILHENDKEAAKIRDKFEENDILCVNLMSSPGAGKTTLLEATIKSGEFKIAVIEGDLETNRDADRILKAGAKATQITTGQTCHLDAFMVNKGLENLDLKGVNLVFIENVGNLVCPASYDVGAHLNAVLLSVPEGDDKIAKYPVMFRAADLVIITKIELLEHFDFDLERAKKEARKLNPKVDFLVLDSKSGQGVEKWLNYLKFKKDLK